MKTAAIILGLIVISHNLFSNDLVDIKIFPDHCGTTEHCNNIVISITNNFSDTLVTFSKVYAEGITQKVNVQPILSLFLPNVLLFKSSDNIFVDGTIDVDYTELPEFYILPPQTERILFLDVSGYQNELSKNSWNLKAYLSFAYKYDLDTLIYYNYTKSVIDYNNKLNYGDTLYLNSNDSVKSKDSPTVESGNNFNVIKNLFKFKFYSKK
ncbi:MAG TPA: hypothetical protein PK605_05370 [Ignavibacteria bacterium]|nr:hypothetical protein [Bacteroidota bacterium]HRE09279.1 hypothetical protein [Ignavibacteria bacterium]HRF66240.1 hypothetical protein [Ignavibacteria bacterium]HRJ03814.1 hypothetical protein [Ignavibacteria bacterium]